MILDTIVAHKRAELEERRAAVPLAELEARVSRRTAGGFAEALGGTGVSIIAELKKASPSKGVICEDFRPQAIARAYERGGADALSCLTDERFFQGCPEYLIEAREACALPVLRKDFTLDEYHIHEAAAMGASAVLLIVAILSDDELQRFLALSEALGLDALLESHNAEEARRALAVGARVLGVNNRDLRDFTVDIRTTERIIDGLAERPEVLVSESGISTQDDMAYLRAIGADAALIGESLMRADDPEAVLRRLKNAGGLS